MQDLINWETQSSTPIQVDTMTITPQTKSLSVRLPYVGFVWNRPSGVLIEENGRVEYQPIIDVTRISMLTFLVMPIVVSLFLFIVRSIRFGGKNE